MHTEVIVELGHRMRGVSSGLVPHIGQTFTCHKNIDGFGGTYEVTLHDWQLKEPDADHDEPFFSVIVKTKKTG